MSKKNTSDLIKNKSCYRQHKAPPPFAHCSGGAVNCARSVDPLTVFAPVEASCSKSGPVLYIVVLKLKMHSSHGIPSR